MIDETPLRAAMWRFARNIFWLSIIISIITAALVYFALTGLLVRPMMRITRNMVPLPGEPGRHVANRRSPPGGRTRSASPRRNSPRCKRSFASLLREKARLANLGLAVSGSES